MKYRVQISRLIRDVQYKTVEVEAASREDAEELVLAQAWQDADGMFWTDAKLDPIESESPEIDEVRLADSHEIHHDHLGWYLVGPDEERDEGGFGPDGMSLGFDGRPHYATEAEARQAMRQDILDDYREECRADADRTGERL
jgi:hypothetical protein